MFIPIVSQGGAYHDDYLGLEEFAQEALGMRVYKFVCVYEGMTVYHTSKFETLDEHQHAQKILEAWCALRAP